jgi:hypothetical protein
MSTEGSATLFEPLLFCMISSAYLLDVATEPEIENFLEHNKFRTDKDQQRSDVGRPGQ